MIVYDVIKSKRDGKELSKEEIDFVVEEFTKGKVADYQMSALLMAIFINKMNERETFDLTQAMVRSGESLDLSKIKGIKVDKHSTGGVADTTTLVLGPMVAACDVPFVKMSGRGLGHTGGTLDKLDAIDGFNSELTSEEFIDYSNRINLSICGQTGNIAPADKKIYALRDVTATVDNLSLIASSIMSKKLALGSDAIVLDVKLGSGAFMKNIEDAVALSKEMVSIGLAANKDTVALVTNMDQPLGMAIGNALEVKEAIEILQGNHLDGDLYKLSLALGQELLLLAGRTKTEEEARELLENSIKSGRALEKLINMVELQGGNPELIRNPELLAKSSKTYDLKASKEGFINKIEAEEVGKCSLKLGAGRETKDSVIDLSAGIVLKKRVGDYVKEGDSLATIHYNNDKNIEEVKKVLLESFTITKEKPEEALLVKAIVRKTGVEYF